MNINDSNSTLNTKDKLIQIGIHLFSKYGFEGTTLRMIAKEANVNLASISFYFGNKENFYKAVLEYASEDASTLYIDAFYNEFLEAKENDLIEKEKALELIEKLISIQLYISINQPIPEYISLLYWEQIQPPENCSPFTEKVKLKIEDTMAYLLTQYEPSLDFRKANVISRFINGGIVTFSEHPAFWASLKSKINQQPSDEFVKNTLKEFIVNSIESFNKFNI